jgi:hypothetical protein
MILADKALSEIEKLDAIIESYIARFFAYHTFHRERVAYFEDAFLKSGAGTLSCRVDESYVKKLLGYFKRRG